MPDINFKLCTLCQKHCKAEKLVDPANAKNNTGGGEGYKFIADSLVKMNQKDLLDQDLLKEKVKEYGENLSTFLKMNNAKWHKRCRVMNKIM